jgi:hypothetical protein
LHVLTARPGEGLLSLVVLCLLTLGWFVGIWRKEFAILMSLRDEEFPGRHDKLIWAVVLLAFAPITVWFFRSYRLAYVTGPKSVSVTYSEPDPHRRAGTATQPA